VTTYQPNKKLINKLVSYSVNVIFHESWEQIQKQQVHSCVHIRRCNKQNLRSYICDLRFEGVDLGSQGDHFIEIVKKDLNSHMTHDKFFTILTLISQKVSGYLYL